MDLPAIRNLFAQRKLRSTEQREAVYAALVATKVHPTAEELFTTVRLTQPGISLATIYNTLEAFTKAGLCRRLATPQTQGNSSSPAHRFDADMSEHTHLVTLDGQVHDLPEDLSEEILGHLPPALLARIEERMGVRLGRMSVEFIQGA